MPALSCMWHVCSLVAAWGLLSCSMQTLSCGMHVRFSSLTRDRTHIPCTGKRILNHCTIGEVPRPQYFWRVFVRYLLNVPHLGFVSCFLMIRLGLWVWGKNTREVRYSSHCIISKGAWYHHDLFLVMLTLSTWLKQHLSDFSTAKLLFFLFSESKSQSPVNTQGEEH